VDRTRFDLELVGVIGELVFDELGLGRFEVGTGARAPVGFGEGVGAGEEEENWC